MKIAFLQPVANWARGEIADLPESQALRFVHDGYARELKPVERAIQGPKERAVGAPQRLA